MVAFNIFAILIIVSLLVLAFFYIYIYISSCWDRVPYTWIRENYIDEDIENDSFTYCLIYIKDSEGVCLVQSDRGLFEYTISIDDDVFYSRIGFCYLEDAKEDAINYLKSNGIRAVPLYALGMLNIKCFTDIKDKLKQLKENRKL